MLHNLRVTLRLLLLPFLLLAAVIAYIYGWYSRFRRRRFVDRRLREKAALAKKNSPPESSGGGEA